MNLERLVVEDVTAYITKVTFVPGSILIDGTIYGPCEAIRGPVTVYLTNGEVFTVGKHYADIPKLSRYGLAVIHYRIHVTMIAPHNYDYATT